MKLLEKLEMEQIASRDLLNALLIAFNSFDNVSDKLDTRHALLMLDHACECAHKSADESGEYERMVCPSRARHMAHLYINAVGEVLNNLIDRDPKPDNVPTSTRDKWHSEVRDEFLHRLIIAHQFLNSGEAITDSDGDACTPQYAAYESLAQSFKKQYLNDDIGLTEFSAKWDYLMDIYNILFLKAKP